MLRREFLPVALLFGVLAVLWTWPLAARIATEVAYDSRFATAETAPAWSLLWELDWVRTAVSELRTPFRTERAFWPGGTGLARADLAVPWAIASWPLATGCGDVCALNALLLGLFTLSATAMFGLARALGATRTGAVVAGFGWAFAPWFVQRGLESLALGPTPWPPAAAGLAWSLAQAPTVRARCTRAAALGAVVGLAATTSLVVVAWLLPVVPVFFALGRRAATRAGPAAVVSDLSAGAWAGLVAVLVAAPLAAELAHTTESSGPWVTAAVAERAGPPVVWADFVTPPGLHPMFAGHPTTRLGSARPLTADPRAEVRSENAGLYLGVGLSTLFVLGLAASARLRPLGLLALLGLLLARDPGGVASAATGVVPGFEALGSSALWLPVTTLALALGAGLGLDALAARPRGRAAAAVLSLLVGLESWVGPWVTARADVPEVVRAIERSPGDGAVLTLPLPTGPHVSEAWAVVHRRPLVFRWLDHGEIERALSWRTRAPDVDLLAASIAGASGSCEAPWPTAQGLSFDLEVLDVDHVLVATSEVPIEVPRLLDAMERWERGASDAGLAWWYRSGLLVPH